MGIIKKAVCENKNVFIIEYFKQLLITRNSSNSEGYRNSDSFCTTRLESLRCLLHHCSSGQWWRKASEMCALLWFKRETEHLIPVEIPFLSNLSVFLNLMLSQNKNFKIYVWLTGTQVQWLKLIRPDNYDFVTQGFTISPRNYSDCMESSLTENVEYLHLILTTYISRSLTEFKLQFQVQVQRWSSNKVNFSVYI